MIKEEKNLETFKSVKFSGFLEKKNKNLKFGIFGLKNLGFLQPPLDSPGTRTIKQ